MKLGYRIQITPLGTGKGRVFTLKRWQMRLLSSFTLLLMILLIASAFHQTRIALTLSSTAYLEKKNSALLLENERYREALVLLESVMQEQKRIHTIGRILLAPADSVPELANRENTLLSEDELEQHIARFERDSSYNEESRPNLKPVVGIITQEWKDGEEKHHGVDIAAPLHDPVYSTAPGIISKVEKSADLGLMILIDHGESFQTLYAHLGRALVQRGDPVHRGTPIGTIGMTGNTSGPHLHYEVRRNGIPENPANFFVE